MSVLLLVLSIAWAKDPKLKHDQGKHLLVCESGKHLIWIDFDDRVKPADQSKVRYRSFKLGASTSAKPEIDLKGDADIQGSAHNATYTFKNGDYTYEVEDDNVCSDDEFSKKIGRCMPSLTVSKGNQTLSSGDCAP